MCRGFGFDGGKRVATFMVRTVRSCGTHVRQHDERSVLAVHWLRSSVHRAQKQRVCRRLQSATFTSKRLFRAAELWPGTRVERWKRLGKDVLFAGALGLASDAICQLWVEQLPSMSSHRAFALTSFTALYNGALCHFVYPLYTPLSRCFMPASASAMLVGLGCTMIDNVIHSPLLYLPSYYLYVDTVQGATLAEAAEHLRQDWLEVAGTCFAIWVPIQGINFSVVPPAQRVMFMNVCLLTWNVLLDYMSHRHD